VPEEAVVPRVLRVLVMARRYDEALARCHRRLLQKPEDRGTRLVEAAILQALERPHEAEHDLGLLVKTQPKDPNPYLALGKLYRDTYHDATRARAMFEKYLALAPKGDEAEALRYQIVEEPPPVPDPPAPVAPSPTPAAPSVAPAAPAKPAGRPSRSAAPPATPAPLFTAPSTPEATP
jgi:regulator of sirC expression with transglutaminase-like and TPR domain